MENSPSSPPPLRSTWSPCEDTSSPSSTTLAPHKPTTFRKTISPMRSSARNSATNQAQPAFQASINLAQTNSSPPAPAEPVTPSTSKSRKSHRYRSISKAKKSPSSAELFPTILPSTSSQSHTQTPHDSHTPSSKSSLFPRILKSNASNQRNPSQSPPICATDPKTNPPISLSFSSSTEHLATQSRNTVRSKTRPQDASQFPSLSTPPALQPTQHKYSSHASIDSVFSLLSDDLAHDESIDSNMSHISEISNTSNTSNTSNATKTSNTSNTSKTTSHATDDTEHETSSSSSSSIHNIHTATLRRTSPVLSFGSSDRSTSFPEVPKKVRIRIMKYNVFICCFSSISFLSVYL
jgi:papilin